MTDPSDPGTDASLGMQLAREGRFAQALPLLDRANRAAPADVALLNAVGNLLVLAGRGDDAQQRYRLAATALPFDLKLLCGWARISLMLGDPAQAAELFARAIAVDRRCAHPGGWLESILFEVADADTAADLTQALVARLPSHSGVRGVHAKMLLACERLNDAQAVLETYLSMCPHDIWARVKLGGLAVGRGDQQTARSCFLAALERDRYNPDALWGLAELVGFGLDADQIATLETAIACSPQANVRARLHEALVLCHERGGDPQAAWRHATSANALRLQATAPTLRHDTHRHEQRVIELIGHCTQPLLERLRTAGNPDTRPVFVIGLPRSGTTLLERMLAAHPHIVGVGEQGFAEAAWRRAVAACGQSHAGLTQEAVASAANWHLRRLEQRVRNLGLQRDAARIVDKLPDNYLLAGWLSVAFPTAAIIHVQRDPRDVALSCWLRQFGDNAHWIHDLDHIAHRIELHRRIMRHWRAALGSRVTEVRYEDLIAEPEVQLRRILAAMGVDWHPGVLDFAQHGSYVATASRMQVREPIHARSMARWRRYAFGLEPILPRLSAVAMHDAIEATPAAAATLRMDTVVA
ncbi:MAG: sulfotransferase [Proteobacteria bacterium]|nr:sulfotransferase [Pseudomonadota bacterium]